MDTDEALQILSDYVQGCGETTHSVEYISPRLYVCTHCHRTTHYVNTGLKLETSLSIIQCMQGACCVQAGMPNHAGS